MENMRVYDLAKKIGKSNKDVLAALEKIGIKGKKHSSSIDEETATKVRKALKQPAPKKEKGAAAKPAPEKKKAEKKKQPPKAKPKTTGKGAKKAPEARPAPTEAKTTKKVTTAAVEEKRPKPTAAQPPERKPEAKGRARGPEQPLPGKPKAGTAPPPEEVETPVTIPEEEAALKVPDRFRKDMEAEKVEKFKGKPSMQKAFQAVRKIDHARRFTPGVGRKRGRDRSHVRQKAGPPTITAPRKKSLKVQEGTTVKEFAELVGVKLPEVIKKFMELGYTPTINQPLDMDAALLVADGLNVTLEVAAVEDEAVIEEAPEDVTKLRPRPPIVTIMGHVDHGKTSLLDAIRETKVIDTEAGGITQHIGAYKVSLKGKDIVFLDTPGHEAFTALRARGAKVTDIVILIVAADDGVKPQTVEAIDHAKAAGVPIIVAANKIDKPEANIQKVKTELSEHGIMPEEWGGQHIFSEISAKQRMGIEELLELVTLQAEVMELKANPERRAKGVIIEAKLDKGRGPVATLLVQSGTLNIGDIFLSGANTGRVRAMYDDMGKKLKTATPSTPVELIGFGTVPTAGDTFAVIEDERKARQIAVARLHKLRSVEIAHKRKLTLEDLYSKIKEGEVKDLNIVIKGDVQGSVEAIKDALAGITHPEVQVKVIHAAVGGINESDVMLAAASNAIIIGFNVRPEPKASQTAEQEGVDIELYNVIYEAIDDVKKALEGMLEPTIREKVLGRAEVREVFRSSRLGTIAGCMVTDGVASRNSDGVRVIRDNIVVYEGKISSLKRFKEDAREVASGYECGLVVENYNDIKVGDILENFVHEKVAPTLA
jgi:translation initiation factor IF-2